MFGLRSTDPLNSINCNCIQCLSNTDYADDERYELAGRFNSVDATDRIIDQSHFNGDDKENHYDERYEKEEESQLRFPSTLRLASSQGCE